MDNELRKAAKEALKTGSVDDLAKVVVAGLRSGEFDIRRVTAAAGLGNPAALQIVPTATEDMQSYVNHVEIIMPSLTDLLTEEEQEQLVRWIWAKRDSFNVGTHQILWFRDVDDTSTANGVMFRWLQALDAYQSHLIEQSLGDTGFRSYATISSGSYHDQRQEKIKAARRQTREVLSDLLLWGQI